MKYIVSIKEKGGHEIVTSYTGDVDEQFVINWFGLNDPDVESYSIKVII